MAEPILTAVALEGERFWETMQLVWQRGDALMPLDPSIAPDARRRLLERMRPQVLIDDSGQTILPNAAAIQTGTAFVVPTSGTSGKVKGVVLSRSAVEHSAAAAMRRIGYRREERWLVCLPVHHIAGLMMLARSMLCGSSPVILSRFDVEAIRAEKRTTLTAVVPTALLRILDAGIDLSHYTAVRVGGARIPEGLLQRAAASGFRIVNGYGMTETCGGCVLDGVPLDGVGVRLAADQEILLSGPVLMDGYRLDPQLSTAALTRGWLHTGDRGSIDPAGRLSVLGRLDDTIISGGENIDPEWVEEILRSHPAISDCAVAGIEDERWGQVVAAAVVPAGAPVSLEEIRDFVGSHASRKIAPRRLIAVESIPRTATGKVRRGEVSALFGTD